MAAKKSVKMNLPLVLEPESVIGRLEKESGEAPIAGAAWYVGYKEGDGVSYIFPAGALAEAKYLTADLLLDGNHLGVFQLKLQEGEDGPAFLLYFGLLNQCSSRMRMPLEAVDQNRWQYDREGAWLKPMCAGSRVDLAKVDRMTITVLRKSDRPVCWCMTPVTATADQPALLDELILPKGPLLDEFGQSTLHEWPEKSRDEEEVILRLRGQYAAAPHSQWPEDFSKWGGWKEKQVEATGFFRTHFDGKRWWLVDPDGCLFWSAGMDCVRVDTDAAYEGLESALTWMPEEGEAHRNQAGKKTVNYLAANFIRAFGEEEWHDRWAEVALAELKRLGFNTVANWSEWEVARDAGFPYVRPLELRLKETRHIFRDFPDVYHPSFQKEAAAYAEQLRETKDDPAFIGYFLMNEPTWGFASLTPAEGMLLNTSSCETRKALAQFIEEKYGNASELSQAWGKGVKFGDIAEGEWTAPLTDAAKKDLAEFSRTMVEKLFRGLSDACKAVDPNHLNLGARYYTVPPEWALSGMTCFDVFSMNSYSEKVPAEKVSRVVELLNIPVMVGEWHFGALDAGLPGSGIGHVKDQKARGQAYRVYVEDAALQPGCIGVHYFTLYDESALGRFDGENWNIGFLDVCNRPYEPLANAALETHERLYSVASGKKKPFDKVPEYLPKVFL